MIVATYILAALVMVGALLYMQEMRHRRRQSPAPDDMASAAPAADIEAEDPGGESDRNECCGQHLVCEKFHVDNSKLYYEDEELDRFAGRQPDEYESGDIEEFRDVLLTLLPADLPGWEQSLRQRGIALPAELRDEFLLMISDTGQP